MSTSAITRAVNIYREAHDVYVGRARRNQPPSKWGNPYVVGQTLTKQQLDAIAPYAERFRPHVGKNIKRGMATELFHASLECRIEKGELTAADFRPLVGKKLGCFCKPKDCHGDVIALFAEWFRAHPDARTGPPRT